ELAMHLHGRAHHRAAEGLSDCLVAEANPDHRDRRRRLADQLEADAGLVRRARTGRQHDRFRVHGDHLVGRDLVVAVDDDVCPQPAEIMVQVEGEAVVVVDQDDHSRPFSRPLEHVGWVERSETQRLEARQAIVGSSRGLARGRPNLRTQRLRRRFCGNQGRVAGGPERGQIGRRLATERPRWSHGRGFRGRAARSRRVRNRGIRAMRQMTLVAFLQAQNCTNLASSWRHPLSRSDTWSPDYYRHLERVLEEGKFHLGFFDDRLSMPDMYGRDHAHTVAHGIRCVKLDAVTVLTVMGMATERLGLGATYSTSYYEPFHVARLFATLDLMTQGRAAWNVVTSLNDGEAQNMGRDEVIDHDARYDRADEFMDMVLGHWDTWQDDAIVQDKASGLFAEPAKVHRLDYEGRYYRSRGPFTVPRSEQGHPVLIQAGQSGRGRRFGARWGEGIFVVYPNRAAGGRRV